MSKKTDKTEKKSRKEFLLALGLLLVLIAAVLFIIFALPKLQNRTTPTEPDNLPDIVEQHTAVLDYNIPGFTMLNDVDGVTFQNGLSVLCAGRFSGPYLEDQSDEQVQDVLSLIVKNTSGTLIEYGEITLDCGGQTALFKFSGLPAGNAVLVQEQNRMTWTEGTEYGAFTCPACALPGSIVLDFGNEFDVSFSDGVIVVKNKTDADIPGPVTVYYKNMEYDLFMGGITYRATFTDGVGAGQYMQALTNHTYSDTSAIMYMRYAK